MLCVVHRHICTFSLRLTASMDANGNRRYSGCGSPHLSHNSFGLYPHTRKRWMWYSDLVSICPQNQLAQCSNPHWNCIRNGHSFKASYSEYWWCDAHFYGCTCHFRQPMRLQVSPTLSHSTWIAEGRATNQSMRIIVCTLVIPIKISVRCLELFYYIKLAWKQHGIS